MIASTGTLARRVSCGALIACGLVASALALEGCRALGLPSSYEAIPAGDIRLKKLSLPAVPPEIGAKAPGEIAEAKHEARASRLTGLADLERTERVEGAQLPLFFESAVGRAYLRSGPGRAIARGAPAESCPAFGVAVEQPTVEGAVETALNSCLEARPSDKRADCSCQLMAADGALLAKRESFEYARAVSVKALFYGKNGRADESLLIAEERVGPELDATPDAAELARLAAGARRLWLLDVKGPVAALDLEADGTATMQPMAGERDQLKPSGLFVGRWRAEGFRRGRRAGEVALIDADGRKLALLLGYEPAELTQRGAALEKAAQRLFKQPAPLAPPSK